MITGDRSEPEHFEMRIQKTLRNAENLEMLSYEMYNLKILLKSPNPPSQTPPPP